MGGRPARIRQNGNRFFEYRARIVEPARHYPRRGPGCYEERAYGLGGSWVSEGDPANLNEPIRRGIRAPMCPALVDLHQYEINEHRMLTVRGTQRRYRENGGNGYRTTLFFCWQCANIVDGDSWHCPFHGIDYCKDCMGELGRNYVPYLFFEELYVRERSEYDNLEEDRDFETGLYFLEKIPRTCFGSPKHVSFRERDAIFAEQIVGCRQRA